MAYATYFGVGAGAASWSSRPCNSGRCVEVDGIASEIALGPAPVTVLEDETGKGWQDSVPGWNSDYSLER